MKVTDKDVTYVADLANLELTAEERERMVRDLNSILGYIDRLNELDTTNVLPMAQTVFQSGGAMRDDAPKPSLPHASVMSNAPDSDGTLFKVPKVIEK